MTGRFCLRWESGRERAPPRCEPVKEAGESPHPRSLEKHRGQRVPECLKPNASPFRFTGSQYRHGFLHVHRMFLDGSLN